MTARTARARRWCCVRRDGVTRWTYAELWERAVEVARALRACGLGKDGRVGVLMTNRPEWVAAVFGTSLAGGVAVTLSTFSTPSELEHMLQVSGVSVLLFERTVLKKDFAAVLTELEPEIGNGRARRAAIGEVPVPAPPGHGRRRPRRAAAIETWDDFLARGQRRAARTGRGDGRGGAPERRGRAVLLVGLDEQAEGHPERPSRRLHPAVALPAHVRVRPGGRRALLDGQRLLLVGQFRHGAGRPSPAAAPRAATDVRRRSEALELMEAERVNFPFAWPHQWAQLEGAPNWDTWILSSMRLRRFQAPDRAPPHGVDRVVRAGTRLRQHRDLHDHACLPGQHAATR